MGVNRVTSGVDLSGDQHHIPDTEPPDLLLCQWSPENLLPTRSDKAFGARHRRFRLVGFTVEPAPDRARLRVEHDTQTPKGPAVIGDRDEEARRQPIEHSDFAADQGRSTAKAHGADSECVGRLDNVILEPCQLRVGIDIVERAEELLFGVEVPGCPVSANADTNRPGAAALPLGLPDRVEQAFPHPVEIPPRFPEVGQLHRQRVLNILVLAPATLEEQLYLDLILILPLLEVDGRGSGSEVVAAVPASQRIDRVWPEFTAFGRLGNRQPDLFFQPDLVRPDRCSDPKSRPSGVLTDRPFILTRHIDVGRDNLERLRRSRSTLLIEGPRHCPPYIWWQIGRCLRDQLKQTSGKTVHL